MPQMRKAISAFLEDLKMYSICDADIFSLRLCFEEAVINSIKHARCSRKNPKINIEWEISRNVVRIGVEDEGEGFDYTNIPDPTKGKSLFKAGGRGLYLIRKFMDKVEFNKKGNFIKMVKYIRNKTKIEYNN